MSGWPPPSQILSALEGPWSLRRQVGAGEPLVGRAWISPLGKGLARYQEGGDLDRLSNVEVFQQTRRGFRVHFDDGPQPTSLDVELTGRRAALAGRGVCLCGLDVWVYDYVFREDATFLVRREVIGRCPRAPVVTEYRRTDS